MSRPRKTIEVETVRQMANGFLENSRDDRRDQRFGVCSLVEQVLMATGNYKGFGYTTPEPITPGGDDSRRRYYR